ncbi:MAG: DUF5678 domain-containing protein [Acidobacteriota bacterium]
MSRDLLDRLTEEANALTAQEQQILAERLLKKVAADTPEKATATNSPAISQRRKNPHNWIKEHFDEYQGQWVALDGDRLLAHGENAREVLEAAMQISSGKYPFLTKVDAKQGTKWLDIPDEVRYRQREYQWLKAHRHEYPGEHLALEGDKLIAHGKEGRHVLEEAKRLGAKHPLMVYVESPDELPFGGW